MTSFHDSTPTHRSTVVVTGCAGFIGSHLCERLVADGHRVVGIDAFRPFYDRADKLENLRNLASDPCFDLLELDLASDDLTPVVAAADVVFHLAAHAGVRSSFGDGFAEYARDNLVATQRVFEAATTLAKRVVWSSSSSVYGDAATYPCTEWDTPTSPRSPYGVTKRSCEDLAEVYRIKGLEVIGLRYFTVYGPRQRPDMALRRLCEIAVHGGVFPLFGDGQQTRDITYVDDVVSATVLAGTVAEAHGLYNVGGGQEVSMAELIVEVERLSGSSITLDRRSVQAGDVRRTGADTTAARTCLGWEPLVPLSLGLRAQLAWVRDRGPSMPSAEQAAWTEPTDETASPTEGISWN